MALLTLEDVSIGYGGPPLLEGVTMRIEHGERIALLGRNGVGKSTLLKLLDGESTPHDGQVKRQKNLRTARMIQEVPPGRGGSIRDIVAIGLENTNDQTPSWELESRMERIIGWLGLDPEMPFESISSGMKRRVLLGQSLVTEPDVLMLDEPTNHLDVESITWLEDFLSRFAGTLIFITHDRVFMQKLATRIVELERGRLFDWTCDFDTFVKRKEAALEAEAQQEALFDKKLAQEEAWIRTGIKARRTRNEGRVRALQELRRQRAARRTAVGTAKIQVQDAEKSGRLVLEAKDVNFQYDDKPIIQDLSLKMMRGDKIGLLGPNGCGKTTLLRTLLGELEPQSGTIRHGTNLEVAYFDQLRNQIDEEKTVQDNVSGGAEMVSIGGKSRHIIGYLHDFLFSSERARSPARFLSGGERNRLMLAKLFTKPSNVLVLDEPTNDLDFETLELLESLLVDYTGSVLLVSHDRAFLNNVATSVLAFEGEGRFKEYDGGYDDWLRAQKDQTAAEAKPKNAQKSKSKPNKSAPQDKPKKLSFKENRELEELPQRIESLETEQAELQNSMTDPDFFRQDGGKVAEVSNRLEAIQTELQDAYARWEELEARAE
ncbi:ATP-binding cassette domain-containing protein [Thalassoroseus pseudoceratinae]|uniref:ATP-binding cassette domain-containing protein n=1 Tax=Thalassoroseus pseudoceratinae TaxID=2713176 RepID=UPI00141E12FD|nr:ATP-binding cassette domain-containing protein [Thalassoroseus pseudoceratinae]